MAITKFTDISDVSSIYETVVSQETDANLNTPRDKFLKQLVDKIDELTDLINTHITDIANIDSMVLGTTAKTALAGNTTTISTAQANAITANTAKTSMVIGTGANEAMAGNTTIPTVNVTTSAGTLLVQFALTTGKSTTLDIVVTDKSDPSGDVTYTGSVALTQKK